MELGFDAVGITSAEPVEAEHVRRYSQWLDDGCAAKMDYLQRNTEKRFAPAQLLAGAKSVICVVLNYRPPQDQLPESAPIRIARFAQYEDYHSFIKDQLFQLAEFIQKQTEAGNAGKRIKFKACVDSAPLAERVLAQRAGLGFIGKNHMLIHPKLGCQVLLGELITTLKLEPDLPLDNLFCGDCGKCIRACPTGALGADGSFDARKCISYLTIEEPDTIPGDCADKLNGYIFGCDECITVCPHEMNAPARSNTNLQLHPEWQNLTPAQILNMTEDDFQKTFANSGFLRLGLDRLKRNVQCSLK